MESSLDTTKIRIGEQVALTVTVEAPQSTAIEFPSFKPQQELTPGVEVLAMKNDTVDGTMRKVTRVYTLTSFDENDYQLPQLTVNIGGKKFQTNRFRLHVETVATDTTENAPIRPPHDVQDNPFDWHEWIMPVGLILLGIVLAVGVVWLFIRLRHNKPIRIRKKIIRRLLPHEKAMMAIEELKREESDMRAEARRVDAADDAAENAEMSREEREKMYYSRLTEVLRQYLTERFDINAMEMTSSQILDELQRVADDPQVENKDLKDELREVLQTADLVKFAKYSTQDNEKDFYREHVVKFINDTKQPEVPTTETVEPELSASDRQQIRSRRVTIVAIVVLTLLALAALTAAGWHLFELLK